jgi:hypothetical protein
VSLDEEVLAELRPTSLATTLYLRQVYLPPVGDPTPFFVRPHDGRWGTDWTLHTTVSPPTAWAEYCRHIPELVQQADPTGGVGLRAANLSGLAFLELGDPVLRRALFALTYDFDRVLDVRRQPDVLNKAGFGASNLFADDYGLCPELARWASTSGFEAVVAPSAAWRFADGVVCAVLQAGQQRLVREDVVVPSARPTVAVAAATSYKNGEKPSWVGPVSSSH